MKPETKIMEQEKYSLLDNDAVNTVRLLIGKAVFSMRSVPRLCSEPSCWFVTGWL
jgi:hypothetical protein